MCIRDSPYSAEAEQSVLGAMLIEPSCISTVLQYITSPECFYRPQHRELFSIMLQMCTVGENIDFITVLEKARAQSVFASEEDAKVYLTQDVYKRQTQGLTEK